MVEPATAPLPRGRHNLTRAEVAGAQRDRMLVALAEAMAERGFVGTSVGDIIKRAGVSRETFYQQFSSKQDCFLAAFSVSGDLLRAHLTELADAPGTPRQRLDAMFGAYLEQLIEHPAFARLFLVEVYAAGPEAMALRAERQHTLALGLARLLDRLDDEGLLACDVLVAGIGSLVTMPLMTGDHDRLRALRGPLVDLALHQLAPDGARS